MKSIDMEDAELKKLVNKIFAMKGLPKVTSFAKEFQSGGKFHTAYKSKSLLHQARKDTFSRS